MTEDLLVASTPVFTVGGEVKGELSRDLLRLEIEETTAGLRTLFARFAAQGPDPSEATAEGEDLYLDGRILDFGKAVKVTIGPEGGQRILFEGSISALGVSYQEGGEAAVEIQAEDRFMDLRMTRRHRTWEEVSDADLARSIADEHGLQAEVAAEGPTYRVLQQWNMSDLAFLRERARRIQAEVRVLDGTLYFQSRDQRSGPELTLVRGNQLIEISITADLAHQRTKVKVSGYDARQQAAIDEEADDGVLQAEASGGRTGPAVLNQAFGERISYRVRQVPLVDGEARAWAEAEMRRRGRGFVTAVGTTQGTADLVVGSRLTLDGVGAPFQGPPYHVIRVCHTYDLESGHRTQFEAERPTVSQS